MYRTKILFKFAFLCLLLVANASNANNTKIQVVTSFSILKDLTQALGGKHVNVVTLVGRNSDAHMYQPKPSDAVAIAKSDLVIFNGLTFEGWISRLIQNSGYKKKQLIATEGVDAIFYDEEADPHAWQSFKNIRIYIKNITRALSELRPQYASEFAQLQKQYSQKIDALETSLAGQLANIPKQKRVVVTSHDAFGYLGREFDIKFLAPVGLSIEVEASAEDVAAVINQIRSQKVKAIFVENMTSPRMLERIAAETSVAIGGRLYSDALSETDGPASTYLDMMKHNIESLVKVFNTEKP